MRARQISTRPSKSRFGAAQWHYDACALRQAFECERTQMLYAELQATAAEQRFDNERLTTKLEVGQVTGTLLRSDGGRW